LAQKRKEEVDERTVKWLMTQATNGIASAQCSLGLHYLSGQGCETNMELATEWLQKAAEQVSLEASNKLAELK
jgi:TPR repeat protein